MTTTLSTDSVLTSALAKLEEPKPYTCRCGLASPGSCDARGACAWHYVAPVIPSLTLAEAAALLADRERLIEALSFYANPETYFAIGFIGDPPCGEFLDDFEDVGLRLGYKPGKRARSALAGVATKEET